MTVPATIDVRSSREDDIDAITAIYTHAVIHGTASFEVEAPDSIEMGARRAAVLAGGYPHLVAQTEDGVVGYAYAGAFHHRPAYHWTVENTVYVSDDAQGKGVGRALLLALIAACEAKEYRQMVAVIGDSANAASIGLHRSVGFALVGTLKSVGYKHDEWRDSVIMQRALGPGDQQKP